MALIDGRVRQIPMRAELDPTFGGTHPEIAEAFAVEVFSEERGDYNFIALLPEMETLEECHDLLHEVLREFIPGTDKYHFRSFTDKDNDDLGDQGSHTTMLSFDPKSLGDDKIGFTWLVPPRFLMH